MKILAILLFCVAAGSPARAESFVFKTGSARLSIRSDGTVSSLMDRRSEREEIEPGAMAFAAVRKGSRLFAASSVRWQHGLLHIGFAKSGIAADFRVTTEGGVFVVELIKVQGEGAQEIRLLQLRTRLENVGRLLGVEWDENFAVCLMGLSNRVNVTTDGRTISASVYPRHGMEGERVALLAVPTRKFLENVRQIEHRFHLPSPTIDGKWAKRSADVRTSYLFITDLTEANVDRTIRYAKMGGFRYILIYQGAWTTSLGSYPINLTNFPHGPAGLRSVVRACHAAGLKVGLHMMMSYAGKLDPLVSPLPKPGLLADGEAALKASIDRAATTIPLAFPATVSREQWSGRDFEIDEEIVQCGGATGAQLLDCRRGVSGTAPAVHLAGATIRRLVSEGNSYMVDPASPLEQTISSRLASVINHTGIDMIYMDGGGANGPPAEAWFRAGLQPSQIWEKSRRDLLIQSGGISNWSWHILSRGTCDDAASVAVKEYLDAHKIADSWHYYHSNFLPAELGWLGIFSAAPDHAATTPDEIEYDAVRMLALDSAASFETGLSVLDANGRTEEMLRLFGEYERLRLSGTVPETVREQLAHGEWHRTPDGQFHPVRYDVYRSALPGNITVNNHFSGQPFRFRLQVEPQLASFGDPLNIVLREGELVDLSPPAAQSAMPGALIERTPFATALDLATHRLLAVELEVEGPQSPDGESPVLNLQLETVGKRYRDYLVDLNFRGRRTVVLAEPDEADMIARFRPSPSNYPLKSALFSFNYAKVVAINLRWMRYPTGVGVRCRIGRIEALAERGGSVENLRVSTGLETIAIPGVMKTGDYAEYWNEGRARIFDENGVLLRSVAIASSPLLHAGENKVAVQAVGAGSVKLTAITLGKPL